MSDYVTLIAGVGASVALVELLRYRWALSACRREVREESTLSKISNPYGRDVEGAKRDLGAIHDEAARAWLASLLLRLVLLGAAVGWAAYVSSTMPGLPLPEAISEAPLLFMPSFTALLAALRGFPSGSHNKHSANTRKAKG